MNGIKVGVISLGCDKNLVDTENMLYNIEAGGYTLTNTSEDADVIIINTCAFINSAKKESISVILETASKKKDRPFKLIVTGCLPERYKDELLDSLPEVDAFLGVNGYNGIADVIKNVLSGGRFSDYANLDGVRTGRVPATPPHYAYLKIADGCDNHCTYCAIPKIRGRYKSRTVESLVDEAKLLVNDYGVKELNLVAQDVTRYGLDLYERYALLELLERLDKLDVSWIRLLYCYPEAVTDELIKAVAAENKICKYLDIPLQHIDDGVLKLMGRRTSEAYIKNMMDKIRAADERIAVRSTFIAGFPSETEEQFKRLYDFIADYRLNYAGFFAYSKEEGTAAAKLSGHLPQSVKNCRKKELEVLQSAVTAQYQEELAGTVQRVLCEGIDYGRQLFYGRTQQNAPNVDTKIFFKAGILVNAGDFYNVKVRKVDNWI